MSLPRFFYIKNTSISPYLYGRHERGTLTMKFTLPKKTITEITGKMGRLMTAKSSIPILMGILVEAQKDCILFTVSDGTESLIHRLSVSEKDGIIVEEEGRSVFSKETFDVTKKMKGNIVFDANESSVTVSQDKTSLEFAVAIAADYPKIEIENTNKAITFDGKEFEQIVKKTTFAVSTSDSRPILTGVHMTLGEANTFVSTDSHRLARFESGTSETDISVTVPASILEQALKSFDLSKDVMIFPSTNQIAFMSGHTILISRLLEGNFPDTNRLVPTEFKHELILRREEFLSALDLIASLADLTLVKLTISGMSVELFGKGDTSKGQQELFYESYEGEEGFQISFSAKYVMEAIRTITTDSIKISFVDVMKPFIITPVSNEPISELQLILPVRNIK